MYYIYIYIIYKILYTIRNIYILLLNRLSYNKFQSSKPGITISPPPTSLTIAGKTDGLD